jgi:hypothetical protein
MELSKIAREVEEMKAAISKAQSRKDQAEGQLATYMKQLKDKFGCADVVSAKRKLAILERQRDKILKDIGAKYASLKEAMNGN